MALSIPLLLTATAFAATGDFQLKSPAGMLTMHFAMDSSGAPTFEVHRKDAAVLLPSKLGFDTNYADGFNVISVVREKHVEHWKPVYGERDSMPDVYNGATVKLAKRDGHALVLELRAYDEGIAVRYSVPAGLETNKELTEFHFPAHSTAFEEHGGTEGEYFQTPISGIKPLCQAPLTITLPDGSYAAILEAANVNFPLMTLGAEEGKTDTLIAALGGPAKLAPGAFTPWRLIMFAKTPTELLEHNYLQLDLNEKNALADTSWIKPGALMREVTLSNDGAHKTIDFAAAHGIPYILFDDGWYGSEDYDKGDATHERTHDAKGNPTPPLDFQSIIKYGKEHNVGVFLYIDRRQAMKQSDVVFPLFEKWGVVGVKIGFVEVGKQENTIWITDTVRKAAKYHLMLDIHDQYRTTGYTRTYPNLLTVEGIRGNEHFPTAEHDATLPFTRALAGSGDYTICYYDKRLKNTHAHQLAQSIVAYSPLQSLFWYDKPEYANNEPELKWFEHLPTVWDETLAPEGEVGKYAILARRVGSSWYIGAVGDSSEHTLPLSLNFLKQGVSYEATIYTDDPTVQTATHVAVSYRKVTRKDALKLSLLSRGGEAIYITPVQDQGK